MTDIQQHSDDHEYVEYELEFRNGEIVGCEFFGEGRQAVPLTKPMILKPVDGEVWPHGFARLERMVQHAFRKFCRQTDGA